MSGKPENRPLRVHLVRTGKVIEVTADQTILEALMDHDIYIDSLCREGICGTCETKILSGVPEHRDSVLSEEEQASGATMMICVSRAVSEELALDL